MDREECAARLHLLGFDTSYEQPFTTFHDKSQHKNFAYCFVLSSHKPEYVGYLTSYKAFMTANYFRTYEHMLKKALVLKTDDKK